MLMGHLESKVRQGTARQMGTWEKTLGQRAASCGSSLHRLECGGAVDGETLEGQSRGKRRARRKLYECSDVTLEAEPMRPLAGGHQHDSWGAGRASGMNHGPPCREEEGPRLGVTQSPGCEGCDHRCPSWKQRPEPPCSPPPPGLLTPAVGHREGEDCSARLSPRNASLSSQAG